MNYNKTIWEDNKSEINAAKLNNIETGIEYAVNSIENINVQLDKRVKFKVVGEEDTEVPPIHGGNSYDDTELQNKISNIETREVDKEINVTTRGFKVGIDANIQQNTQIIQSLIDQCNDLVLYFPSGISKIGQLNLGSEKNITFRGKSSSFATSVNKSTSTPKVVDTYSQILVNLEENAPWIQHQNCAMIFEKISVINGQINSKSAIEYTNTNLMIETQTNTLKGKVFAFDSSFIGWKSLGGDIEILNKEESILQSCWLANRCRFRNNTIALAQLVDGRITDCSFNKNEYAILMKKGSGFSTIMNNRIEWNTTGVVIKNAHDVKVTDNEFDRQSNAGLIVDGLHVGNIESNLFRRNGALDSLNASDFDNNVHFVISNCENVIVKSNTTLAKSTLDTSSGGITRPSNCSNISNNNNCIISENILNGCTKKDKASANKFENNTDCIIINNIPIAVGTNFVNINSTI